MAFVNISAAKKYFSGNVDSRLLVRLNEERLEKLFFFGDSFIWCTFLYVPVV